MKVNSISSRQVNYTGNFKNNQSKSTKTINNDWSRSKCIIGFTALSAAVLDFIISPKITNKITSMTNTKKHFMAIEAAVGIALLSIGTAAGYVISKIDKNNPTKFGNFACSFFNCSNNKKQV